MRMKTWEKIWKNRTAQSRNKKKPSLICVIRKAIITQQSKTYAIPPAHTEVPFTEKCMNLWLRFVRILPCFYWKWSIIFSMYFRIVCPVLLNPVLLRKRHLYCRPYRTDLPVGLRCLYCLLRCKFYAPQQAAGLLTMGISSGFNLFHWFFQIQHKPL